MRRVIVVGAGVIGLSCAVRLLEAGHRVDVVGRDLPLETTSSVAAAVWSPYSQPQEHVVRWARAAYDAFAALCDDESAGVVMRTGTELFREPTGRPVVARRPAAGRRSRPRDQPAAGLRVGPDDAHARRRDAGLPPLADRPRRGAGRLDHPDEPVRAARPATRSSSTPAASARGCSAATATVAPVRGQVVLVEQVGHRPLVDRRRDAGVRRAAQPRRRARRHRRSRGSGAVRRTPATAESILASAAEIEPRLAGARILRHKVGLRPGRPAVRLERDGRRHPLLRPRRVRGHRVVGLRRRRGGLGA